MSVTLIYGPRIIFDCDTALNEQVITNVTADTSTTIYKQNGISAHLDVAEAFTTGTIGTKALAPAVDMSKATQIRFWIRSSLATNSGEIHFLIDNTANCVSPLNTLDVGALTANTWSQQTLSLDTPANLTSIVSIGLALTANLAKQDIYIDQIELVQESMTFNELSCVGFDNPENEDGFPQAEVEQLLDGSWYKVPPVAATRNPTIDLGVIQEINTAIFLRNFQFSSTQQVTYGGETLSVISTVNSFPVRRSAGTKFSKQYILELKEKTARAIHTIPTSWV